MAYYEWGYFARPLSADDIKLYSVPEGSADGQQIWACLAGLIAVDIWASQWNQNCSVLKVRGDNIREETDAALSRA